MEDEEVKNEEPESVLDKLIDTPEEPEESGEDDVAALKAQLDELKGAKESLERQVNDLNSKLVSPEYIEFLKAQREEAKEPEEDGDDDFETLPMKELVGKILSEANKTASAVKEEVSEELNKLSDAFARKMAEVELRLVAAKDPEFDAALNDEKERELLQDIANANPQWSIEQVFRQYKLEKIAAEHEAEKSRDARRKDALNATFEKGSLPAGIKEEKDLSPEEAGELAYMKVFGR